MTQGQVLDPITAPQSIFLSPTPTRSSTVCRMLSPSPPVNARVIPIPTLLPQGCANIEHPMLMRMWRELGLVASLTRADVGSIIIQYNGPGPLSGLSD